MLGDKMHTDNYWTTLKWPAAPNLDDCGVFEQYCKGRVLLLGSTRLLLPLATEAWDLEPKYTEKNIAPCLKCDTCVKLQEQGIR